MFKEYDVFDLADGLYHWLQHNWSGQDDPLYAAFCELTAPGMYQPSASMQYFNNISDSGKDVYDSLTVDNYKEALNLVLNYESKD